MLFAMTNGSQSRTCCPANPVMSAAPPTTIADSSKAIGRSKGGLSSKIHALVDALGNPLRFLLTPGQAHDLIGADALLPL